MMLIFILFLCLIAFGGGGWGYSQYGAAGGMSPLAVLFVILLALYFTGNLHV
jgi:hypothetical protein